MIQFNNLSTGGFNPTTYVWNFGSGAVNPGPNPYTGANPPPQSYTTKGIFSISLTMTDSYGCTSTHTLPNYLTIDTPVASFTVDDSFATCPPLLVHFKFTGSYERSVFWRFGDGGASDTVNTAHLYGIPGKDTASLTVFSPGGCVATASIPITVLGSYGTLTYAPLGGCDSLTVNFNVATSNVISYTWIFGDGPADTIVTTNPNISHTYTAAGSFLPFVKLTDTALCSVPIEGSSGTIVVDSVKARFVTDKVLLCSSGNIQFTDSSFRSFGTVITNYSWNFGDGSTLSGNDPNPIHTYTSPGFYTVTLIVTTQFGCTDTYVQVNAIKVVASPVVGITGDSSRCVPASIQFQGVVLVPDTSTNTSWIWNFSNGGPLISGQVPAPQIYTKAGYYPVQLTVTNSSGCTDVVTDSFYVYPLPNVFAGNDTTICLGQSITLNATGAATYNWLPPSNAGLSCNCANPVASPNLTTTYYVTGTSGFGCQASDSITVTVNQPVTVTAAPLDSVCIGQSVPLHASGAVNYSWSPATGLNDPNIADPLASPAASTTYMVVGSDNKFCFYDTQYVTVTVFNYPSINLGPPVTNILVGSSYQFNPVASADIVSVNWMPVTGLSCTTCLSPLATPQSTTSYVATVVNNGGCAVSDTMKIIVICNQNNFFVPNTFSPNGDGVNDIFYVRGKGLDIIPSITIFNRWGQIVFQKRDFAANDPSAGWDGTINGKPAPIDVYVYTLDIICDNSTLIPYHGNITLIR